MERLRSLTRQHRIAAFVLLTWAISWAYWIPMALRGEVATPGGTVTHFPGLIGPLLAALIVTAITDGATGLRDLGARMVRWAVRPFWYAMAALPLVFFAAGALVMAATGAGVPGLADLGRFSGLPELAFPIVVLLVLVFNGYGEETGWRGLMTHHLLATRGPIATSVFVAAAWFTWHVPAFFVVETYRLMGVAIVPMMGIGILSGAIILTWLYSGTGRSVLLVVLWHVALNFASATAAGRGVPGALVWVAAVLWALVVLAGWITASEPASRPNGSRLRDGFMIAVLRSPLGRFLPGMTVVAFHGRRSGRTLVTPVECVRDSDRILVYVGNPDRKQWWRNVQADPEVTVEVEGRDVPARATVHADSSPEATADLATLLERRPRLARYVGVGDPPVNPDRLASAAAGTVSVRFDLDVAA